MAVGFVTDLLKHAPKGQAVPVCAAYVTKNVLRRSRLQLRKEIAVHGEGDFFYEVVPVDSRCITATDQTAVFEIRGGLVCWGVANSSPLLVIAATVFRVRLTFEHCALPGKAYVPAPIPRPKQARRPDPQPFPVRAIDFNYENIR